MTARAKCQDTRSSAVIRSEIATIHPKMDADFENAVYPWSKCTITLCVT